MIKKFEKFINEDLKIKSPEWEYDTNEQTVFELCGMLDAMSSNEASDVLGSKRGLIVTGFGNMPKDFIEVYLEDKRIYYNMGDESNIIDSLLYGNNGIVIFNNYVKEEKNLSILKSALSSEFRHRIIYSENKRFIFSGYIVILSDTEDISPALKSRCKIINLKD